MPTAHHTIVVNAGINTVWDYVRNLDNWARFLIGYQKHSKTSENISVWSLKGELGGITRIAEFEVQVLEWAEPKYVRFKLVGRNEPFSGGGEFRTELLESYHEEPELDPPPRILASCIRWLVFKIFKRTRATDIVPVAGYRKSGTLLSFELTVAAGGAMGPVLNLMLEPLLKPVAEELATNIAHALAPA